MRALRAPLQRRENASIDTALAFAVCALVLLVLSNAYPLVAMQVNGSSRDTTLIGAALGFYAQGFESLAALVFTTTWSLRCCRSSRSCTY